MEELKGYNITRLKYVISKNKTIQRLPLIGRIEPDDFEVIKAGVSKEYVLGFLNSDYFSENLRRTSSVNVISNVFKWSDLLNERILIPSPKIQDTIIEAQMAFRNLVEEHKHELDKLLVKVLDDPFHYPDKIVNTLESILEFKKLVKANDRIFKITQTIISGESEKVEFKETFNVDVKTGKKEKYIQESSLKNIVGFLNANGGQLFIGVNDLGEITGVRNDDFVNDDKYLLNFKNHIKTKIGEDYYSLIHWELIYIHNKPILVVDVKKSKEPTFLYGTDFYVRTSPAVDKLEGKKQYEYIRKHFK